MQRREYNMCGYNVGSRPTVSMQFEWTGLIMPTVYLPPVPHLHKHYNP